MARYYRMTPARRNALRKAQIASAKKRKRRRKVAVTTISVTAIGGGAIGGYKAKQYTVARKNAKWLKKQEQHQAWSASVYQRWAQRAMRPGQKAISNKSDVTTFGKIRIGGGVMTDKSGKQRGNVIGAVSTRQKGEAKAAVFGQRVFKVGSEGPSSTRSVNRLRADYDARRRAEYNSAQRTRKYINWDKPRRQAQKGKGQK
jgi:hypothetical protein